MRKWVIVLLIFLISIPIALADITKDSPFEEEAIPTRIVYQGSTAIRDSIASKASANAELSTATTAALKDTKYPYALVASKTALTINKYRCDQKMQICGYWISAIRDMKEVQTNSPIWISPPPYQVVVSEIYDSTAKENVVTVREDPKLAVEQVLQGYVDGQPLGKATVGTRE